MFFVPPRRGKTQSAMRWLIILALLVAGCQHKPAPQQDLGYRYPALKGPTVDDEIRFYKQRVEERPDSFLEKNFLAGAYLAKAQSRSDPGYFALAQRVAQESLKIMPTQNEPAKLVLASVAEAQHDFKTSQELAEQVYAADPSNLEALALMANSDLERGEVAEAVPAAERMVARAPTSGALNFRARVFMAQGEDSEAERYLLEAVKREQPQEDKVSARSRSLLGELYLRQGQLEKAEQALQASLAIDGRNPFTLADLGRLAERQGKPSQALDYYAQAYDSTRNPAMLVEIARLKRAEGKTEEARKIAAQAEEKLKPELEAGGYGHARDMARLWLDQGKVPEARALLAEELQRRHDVRTLELAAEAAFRAGDREAAGKYLAAIIATGWKDPVILARVAQVEGKEPPGGASPWPAP